MIGDFIRAFDNPNDPNRFKQLKYSEGLSNLGEKTAGQASTNLDLGNKATSDYLNRIYGNQPKAEELFGNQFNLEKSLQNRNYNAEDQYKGLMDYLTGKINTNVLGAANQNLVNQVQRNAAARGINSGLDSTYNRLLMNQINASNYLPAFQSILGAAGNLVPQLNQTQTANDLFRLSQYGRGLEDLNQLERRPLAAEDVRNQVLNNAIMQGNSILPFLKGNVAGFLRQKSGAEKWADAMDALKSGAWEGLSFYSSLMGAPGMGGGGGMGGMGGGRGQQQQKPPTNDFIRNNQMERGYGMPNYGSAYDRYYGENPYGGMYGEPYPGYFQDAYPGLQPGDLG